MDPSTSIVCQSSPPVYILPPIVQNRFIDDTRVVPKRSQITNDISQRTNTQTKTYYCSTQRSRSQNNEKSIRIPFKIHDGFASNEETIIRKAIKIISNRLFKPEVLQNMYQHCGRKGVCLAVEVWQRSNLSKHSINHDAHFLLQYQLMRLKAKSENDEFPIINIHPIYEENSVGGRGSLACVSCISHGSHLSINSQFEIYLNRYYLHTSTENDSDIVYWAGLILHEMLHNLGHNYDDRDYSDRWQINVFTKCFEHNGNY